jgi:hypothetical protein
MNRLEQLRAVWIRREVERLREAQWRGFRIDREEAIRLLMRELKTLISYK